MGDELEERSSPAPPAQRRQGSGPRPTHHPSLITSLWRSGDFLKLWAAETISVVGSQVTLLALPLTAALTLQATPAQMGLLAAAETAPFLLIGLPAGAWVDRLRRRPVMIWPTSAGR